MLKVKKLNVIFSCVAASLFGLSQVAVAQQVEQPVSPNCYMQTESGKIINLGNLCGGGIPASTYQQNNYVGGYPSDSYLGNCQYSWQVDSSGKTCGDRSASSRPGYSYGSSYTPSYSGSTGEVYVRPYTRSDGTYVRGHWRNK
ncbi:hypothetical protein [Dendronalium sp. ChiSLP03b]|uniref:hypothetical protein n=1 Tax=Dendronalium sp. ChiSLP03b TaxID=3075381 RepID=UPI00391CBC1B